MTDTRIEAICELCDTPIVNGAAGWRHLVGMGGRGGCGLAEPPALPLIFTEVEPLPALALSGCSSNGCATCG